MHGESARRPSLSTPGWRKSSYSDAEGACVEIDVRGARIAFRDSKDPNGPELVFSKEQFSLFVRFAAISDLSQAHAVPGQLG